MAGNWIKMRVDLPSDPAVMRLSDLLGADRFTVVGWLHAVWAWADTHADRHGRVTLVSRSCLDSVTGRAGFGDALEAVGWLESVTDSHGGIAFPRFDRHMGEGAKQRASAAKRQQNKRDRDSESRHAPRHARVTPKRDTCVTREEKRREENNNTPQPPARRGAAGEEPCDVVPFADPPEPVTRGPKLAEVEAHWNAQPALTPVTSSDPNRDRVIRAWGMDKQWCENWRAVISYLGTAPKYTTGKLDFRPTLSWLFERSNFAKALDEMRAPPRIAAGTGPPAESDAVKAYKAALEAEKQAKRAG